MQNKYINYSRVLLNFLKKVSYKIWLCQSWVSLPMPGGSSIIANTQQGLMGYKCTESLSLKEKRNSMKGTQSNSMDNGKAYLPSIQGKRDYKSILLSYRIYNRLSQEEKHKFNLLFLQYPPLVSSLALYLRKKMNIPIQKVLFIKAQRDMLKYSMHHFKFLGLFGQSKVLLISSHYFKGLFH